MDRFAGDDGERVVVRALEDQTILHGLTSAVANELAAVAQILPCEIGSVLIEQNDSDNDLYLILSGSFSIIVNGRPVGARHAGQHVGEMAVIDPKSTRSASVIALEDAVVAKLSEPNFAKVADRHPRLWRNIACELGERLRQRNDLVRPRNEVPRIFVGSSVEALAVANNMQSGLAHEACIVTVWTNGVFGPSQVSIEALERVAAESDFAALVLGSDDYVRSRGVETPAPRDNVVFELGLFIGALGRRRVFLVFEDGVELKLPSDLLGVTPLTYKSGSPEDLPALLGPVCTAIRAAIKQHGAV